MKIEDSTQLGEQNRLENLSIDYSTDTNGNILSMNYVETGGYSGKLFAVSVNSGNIVAWSTILGINNYAAIRDPNNAYIDPREIYNPNDINVPLGWNGKKGNNITIQQVGTGNDLIFNAGGSGFSITNLWGATDITDSTTTTTTGNVTKQVSKESAIDCFLDLCQKLQEDFKINFERGIVTGDWTDSGQDKKLEDMGCNELERAMEKTEFDYNGIGGKELFGDLSNPIGVANKIYDYVYVKSGKDPTDIRENRAKHHAIYDACQYWQMKQEYDKRVANGEC